MSTLWERLGVARIVNAKGPATRLSGPPLHPAVAEAMAEAALSCVDLLALQARASAIIAAHTGAEAGLVTSGAAAGLLLGAAACTTGLDPAAMARLPVIGRGGRNEIVMVRSQRNQYDHALRAAGLRIVEVGLPDRFAGAGCRDAEPWEIRAALGERSACVHYVAGAHARPPLGAVVEVAHRHGVPVLVDAAAQLPPRANLRRFIAAGADLVAFSGGKAIGGPQASGILCGRRDLVAAAALQMLDMDYPDGGFAPPPAFIDTSRLPGLPPHGIGRPCKVGKEQIVGLLVALERFVATDEAAEHAGWVALLERLAAALADLPAELTLRRELPVPLLEVAPRRGDAHQLVRRLAAMTPAVHVDPEPAGDGRVVINPTCLLPDDEPLLARQLRAALQP